MIKDPKLLLPTDYISDVTDRIRQAQSRVCLLSMVMAHDSSTNEIVDALCEAAERGVDVEIAADVFTYGELGGFFLPTRYRFKQSRKTTKMSNRFTESGVNFTWLGRSRTTIFSGRTHIKWCVVDDIVYSFGGVNLYKKGIKNNDYMFKIHDMALADKLIAEFNRLARADAGDYSFPSHALEHGDDQILIDGGFFGDSIIYRHACQLTAQAEKVILVSQYCPTGKLSRLLKKSDAKLYFNPNNRARGLSRLVIATSILFYRNQTAYRKKQYLHAKFMLFYMPGDSRVAITGSHNFVKGGVMLGTREIALQTKNPQVINQLEDFLNNYIV